MTIENVNVLRKEKLLVWMSLRAVIVNGVCWGSPLPWCRVCFSCELQNCRGTVYCTNWKRNLGTLSCLALQALFLRVRKICVKRLLASPRPPLGGFSWNLILAFFENLSRKFKFH